MNVIFFAGLISLAAAAALGLASGASRTNTLLRVPDERRADTPDPPAAGRNGGARRARSAAIPKGASAPLLLELVGAMLQAGLALPRALGIAARFGGQSADVLARAAAALELGAPWSHAWPDEPSDEAEQIRAALHFAATTGAPSAELLFARARQLRRTRHRELEKRAAALGVRLVVPLGVCSLPAFLCLGVIPVLLAMIPDG
ncbi:hypothetical protein GCM10012320_21820 [Sinomonas cellulolyticus]|uniref:Type II secretion system F family protein n=1 Tax=Sinomonas cellulolyticus TaxID=2801916 RepID=A0ABS1K1Y3_9MICC|nr:type II secretion system F family protein [Sinomonas cellulolyticus]GHG51966.1 hypothetical protein GCM10012320_21820 [Sinomonas sp. KCTC 49339]